MIHINRYIDKITMFESKRSKDFTMSMREAKDLHCDITKLLLTLQEVNESIAKAKEEDNTVTMVEISGGTFNDV